MNSIVTVLIPSYNPGKYLRKAIESVFNQTHQDWRIVLVDDASTDDSLLIVKEYLHDPRVRLIVNPENSGQSNSMNIGLEYVNTHFFLQLDSDDWLTCDALKILVEESNKIPSDVAIITGNVIHVYQMKNGKQKKEKIRTIRTSGRSFHERYDILLSNYIPYPRFYRTSAVRHIGGWPTDDPWKGRHVEDLRIFLRLLEHFRFHWIDHVLYNYRLHEGNSTNQKKVIAKAQEWIVRDALERWGDEFEPMFKMKNGLTRLQHLTPKKSNSNFLHKVTRTTY